MSTTMIGKIRTSMLAGVDHGEVSWLLVVRFECGGSGDNLALAAFYSIKTEQ
jgi:hypothetical protein